jgi:hypothetical protein
MSFTHCFNTYHGGRFTAEQVHLPVLAELDRVFGATAKDIQVCTGASCMAFTSPLLGPNRVAHVLLQSPGEADFAQAFVSGPTYDMVVIRSYPGRARRCCGLLAPATTKKGFSEKDLSRVIGQNM